MGKQPTILDVARKSGFSKSTVSLVLQDSSEIPETTKNAVHLAIKQLGYRHNRFARGLRTRRSNTVGMIIQDHLNPFYAELVQHVEVALLHHGLDLVVGCSHTDLAIERQVINRMFEHQVDGLIVSTTDYEQIADLLKFVHSKGTYCVLGGAPAWEVPFDSACIEHGPAVREVMKHLFHLGHRDVGFIWGAPSYQNIGTRFEAFRHALEIAGLAVHPEWIKHCGIKIEDGYQAARELLDQPARPTAILVLNDLLAIGAMAAATDLGLVVSRDVSIVGVDNVKISGFVRPALTTVSQPTAKYARTLADLVASGITREEAEPPRRMDLLSELVIRDSTGRKR